MTETQTTYATVELDEGQFVELIAALELARAAAQLVPGGDANARTATINELIDTLVAAEQENN